MNDTPHRLKIAFTLDGLGVDLWSNDRTLYFSREMWGELLRMAEEMYRTNSRVMTNFEEPEPVRTPTVFPECPRKFDIGDLA